MKLLRITLLSAAASLAYISTSAAAPKVVTSIKPIHSLTSIVMQGVGEPQVIITGAQSPHDYALAPSQAAALQEADIVFWVGHELEAFLEKSIETIAQNATSVELIDTEDLLTLEFRESGIFDEHKDEHHEDEHGDEHHEESHGEDGHDEAHHKDEHSEHNHDEEKHDDEHAGHDEENSGHNHDHHGGLDPHIWLDPENAKILISKIADTLIEADPENAATYRTNLDTVLPKLDALLEKTRKSLTPVQNQPYVVFHDGYQYFENRFGLTPAGALTLNVEASPGVEHIRNIQHEIAERNAKCVFSEPQFDDRLVVTVAEGTGAKTAILDPLGAAIEEGPDQYFQLIRNMTKAIKSCLAK